MYPNWTSHELDPNYVDYHFITTLHEGASDGGKIRGGSKGVFPTAVKIAYFTKFTKTIWLSQHITKVTLGDSKVLNEWLF